MTLPRGGGGVDKGGRWTWGGGILEGFRMLLRGGFWASQSFQMLLVTSESFWGHELSEDKCLWRPSAPTLNVGPGP